MRIALRSFLSSGVLAALLAPTAEAIADGVFVARGQARGLYARLAPGVFVEQRALPYSATNGQPAFVDVEIAGRGTRVVAPIEPGDRIAEGERVEVLMSEFDPNQALRLRKDEGYFSAVPGFNDDESSPSGSGSFVSRGDTLLTALRSLTASASIGFCRIPLVASRF
jgi:hypothetical protein